MMNLENFPDLMSAPLLSVLDTVDNQISSKSTLWNRIELLLFFPFCQTTCELFFFSSLP